MKPRPVGPVTVAASGTSVPLYSGLTEAEQAEFANPAYRCCIIRVQALPGNTGVIAFGLPGMNQATGANVISYLQKGETLILDSLHGNELQASIYALDASAANQGAIVTFLEN